jgi:hypothetical protein
MNSALRFIDLDVMTVALENAHRRGGEDCI